MEKNKGICAVRYWEEKFWKFHKKTMHWGRGNQCVWETVTEKHRPFAGGNENGETTVMRCLKNENEQSTQKNAAWCGEKN